MNLLIELISSRINTISDNILPQRSSLFLSKIFHFALDLQLLQRVILLQIFLYFAAWKTTWQMYNIAANSEWSNENTGSWIWYESRINVVETDLVFVERWNKIRVKGMILFLENKT